MMNRILFACLFLALSTESSSLSCRWMDHKFRQHNEETLNLLDTMAKNATNTSEVEVTVAFPNHLYHQVSKSSAEDKLAFSVQILEEVAALFEEDHSAASWEDSTVRNFLNIVNKQAEELHSCTEE
ncbi:interferon a3-like [Pundamilia nyererei]|uniref:Interferon a3-like n=1 Tax=Pundamilia nyererei TaxID=303518 RepID=A0A9Y6J7F4_9CICH|nr:PREDICTED: interferon a3-like [Pundamilia nyererei]